MPLGASFFFLEDVPLVEFIYFVFTRTPGGVTVGDSGLCCCVPCLSSAIIYLCWFQYILYWWQRVKLSHFTLRKLGTKSERMDTARQIWHDSWLKSRFTWCVTEQRAGWDGKVRIGTYSIVRPSAGGNLTMGNRADKSAKKSPLLPRVFKYIVQETIGELRGQCLSGSFNFILSLWSRL